MKKIKLVILCVLLVLSAITFTACSQEAVQSEETVVKLGINGDETEVKIS